MPAIEGVGRAAADDEDLRRASVRIEDLLVEVRAMTGPPAWQRVEELVGHLVGLYGAGLGRLVGAIEEANALDDKMRERLAGDDLLASLLALHGLHPFSIDKRIRQALERLQPSPGSRARVELVAVIEGAAHLRVTGSWPASGRAAIERVVVEAAPEVAGVEIEGLLPAPEPEARLVQIGLSRPRDRSGP